MIPKKLDFNSETVSAASLFLCSQETEFVLNRTHPSQSFFDSLFICNILYTVRFLIKAVINSSSFRYVVVNKVRVYYEM